MYRSSRRNRKKNRNAIITMIVTRYIYIVIAFRCVTNQRKCCSLSILLIREHKVHFVTRNEQTRLSHDFVWTHEI